MSRPIFFDDLYKPPVRTMRGARVQLDRIMATTGEPLLLHELQNLTEHLFQARVQAVALLTAAKALPTPDPASEEYKAAEAYLATVPGAPTDREGNRTLAGLLGHLQSVAVAANDFHTAWLAARDRMTAADLFGIERRTKDGVTAQAMWFRQEMPAVIADDLRADERLTILRGALVAAGAGE